MPFCCSLPESWQRTKAPKSKRKLSPIIPVLLYTGDREWSIPLSLDTLMMLPDLCRTFVPQFEFLSLNVPAASREALGKHPIGAVLEAMSRSSGSEAEMEAAMLAALGQLEGLEEKDRDAWERGIIILYLLMYHRRTAEEGARLSSKLEQVLEEKKEVSAIMQTWAGTLMEKGEKAGIEKGELRAMRQVAGDLLRQRFGELPERAEARLGAMDLTGLKALTLAIQSARSLDDLGL